MASKKDNLKSLFSNTRSRVIIVFTAIVLVLAVVIGYVKMKASTMTSLSSANVVNAPGNIQSIPGALNPTAQYVKLQQEQNVSQAVTAEKSGGSAIPTIIQSKSIGEGVGVIGTKNGHTGVGFGALVREEQGGTQQSLWIQSLKDANCSRTLLHKILSQGAQLADIKDGCSCIQLKDNGYKISELEPICSCKELKAAGFNAAQLKEVGYSAGRLRDCGYSACETRQAGFSAQQMKDGGFEDGELKGAGFSEAEIAKAAGLPEGMDAATVRNAGCDAASLSKLRKAGVTASAIRRISGCSPDKLKAAGFTASDLKAANFSAAELNKAGFTPEEMKDGGYSARELLNAGLSADQLKKAGFTADQLKAATVSDAEIKAAGCDPDKLQALLVDGVSAARIKELNGCSDGMLKSVGFNQPDNNPATRLVKGRNADCSQDFLRKAHAAGVSVQTIKKTLGCPAEAFKDTGYSAREMKLAGFTAAELKKTGHSAAELKGIGFTAKELHDAGFGNAELKAAGFSAKDLKELGVPAVEMKKLGYTDAQLKAAGFEVPASEVTGLPNQPTTKAATAPAPVQITKAASSTQQLQSILNKQNQQMAEQKYQQKIQQRSSEMLSAANQSVQDWKKVSTQSFTGGNDEEKGGAGPGAVAGTQSVMANREEAVVTGQEPKSVIKTGDILFAVMDTSVNSDEPGPILATIVSGKLKGAKLIGNFTLPSNANKMVINFNTLSVPGAERTISISAYAVDPNTARTALSSKTNHHYMMRYGSLFASSFLQGFGNAIQTANTSVVIGGNGGGNNIAITSGIGQSTLENAVIGLATVGKAWGQQAQQLMSTPTTVQVYSGTPLGILFTQDVAIS